ncbi:cleavage and polyadenylation specificity factor subunit 4 [Skeletonema marinoi]|jgi:cleavage and polyadenylation specificity factor subunit 4|uniref:Cleavage and polyadenylation specificity factor subunit 4 n=1 Tax=Skeletonema marinoi TaxID=267567 RepID=A0A7S2Q329_9STRA|nr:cleavage and polyadenylation specificity factor subunit 4 [Skeletonema marinoi]|mmetsp:Transcript_4357/g.6349  ORF Transcript_4357/g.6349 Transcript_4357/m.6349 type:complete len:628 (+) Transcript_4357:124-2007(+)
MMAEVGKTVMEPEATNLNMVEYDFENYALTQGIPETLDPLPYRKAGSVFATGDEAEPQLTSAKHDPRLRTVVCRHWLRDLCMKGAACEFLHQYDLSKMPLCRHGDRCKVKDCPFRHISEADRLECVFYSQGFCIHGPFCRYKHVRRERIDLPLVADFTLGLSQMQAGKDGVTVRRPAPKPNEFFKVSLCKHFLSGECPFGDGCHFAHGEAEIRRFPKPGQEEKEAPDGEKELSDNMFDNQETTTVDYYQGGQSGGGRPTPILEPENASFYILRAATYRDCSTSTVKGEWYVQKKHAESINRAANGNRQVMVFFTVGDSHHIQGAALVKSTASYVKSADRKHHSSSKGEMASADKDGPFCYRFKCEWYRTCELPTSTALEAAPDLLLPTSATQYCQDMTSKTGEAVMKAIWNSPLCTLYESWNSADYDDEGEKAKKPPVGDAILFDFRCPLPDEIAWPTMPTPGFIFGCNSQTMDECLGRGLFGLPAHMKIAASGIRPGSSIFLYHVSERLVFGVFEALTTAQMNLEPKAFSKNPNATTSPFPVQIRVRISLECAPVQDDDPALNDILRSRVGGRIGPLTVSQAEALASLIAQQCGALSYMAEYRQGVESGAMNVQAPPIALPPRKIG